ncbi:hypothetical protein Dd1591_0147 [Dickeya chrysanthemi Ech1591]|uniref:Uncharacterized protein n=1 Tax=Dickeya chrysanthemi (strain Ech1591) TaxID=561229 RepID=C6CGG8_DICC1|nr:hypothetical protein Dd1591_0147 [Dickeya chrysanthemi Ech1591]
MQEMKVGYRLDNRIRLHNKHETLKTRITVTHP